MVSGLRCGVGGGVMWSHPITHSGNSNCKGKCPNMRVLGPDRALFGHLNPKV